MAKKNPDVVEESEAPVETVGVSQEQMASDAKAHGAQWLVPAEHHMQPGETHQERAARVRAISVAKGAANAK